MYYTKTTSLSTLVEDNQSYYTNTHHIIPTLLYISTILIYTYIILPITISMILYYNIQVYTTLVLYLPYSSIDNIL